jgi:hypothetical protein
LAASSAAISALLAADPTIIDFVENSGLVPPGKYTRFERLPGGVSSDIWLVHADDRSFCVKRALAQLRVAADWRAPIERNTKEAAWIKAVAGFLPEAVPSLLAEDAAAGMFAMDYLSPPPASFRLGRIAIDIAEAVAVARANPAILPVVLVSIIMNMFAFSYSALIAPIGLDVFRVSPILAARSLRRSRLAPSRSASRYRWGGYAWMDAALCFVDHCCS